MRMLRRSMVVMVLSFYVALLMGLQQMVYAGKGKKETKGAKVLGEITSVDETAKTIALKDTEGESWIFKVTPETKIEVKREHPLKFSELKVGSRVRVKYMGSEDVKTARDIRAWAGFPEAK